MLRIVTCSATKNVWESLGLRLANANVKTMSSCSGVYLLACGSFNPPTNMHLRIFEIAADHFRFGGTQVLGGIMSPVHDAYGKQGLLSAHHRFQMLDRAVQSSDWIKVDRWEAEQEGWLRTRQVLDHHQKVISERFAGSSNSPVVKVLFGADVLESFAVPDLWDFEDIEKMLQSGIVVITRAGSDARQFIAKSELLTKYQDNIDIVTEWIANEISASAVRKAVKEKRSIKYLLQDSVIEYIKENNLYQ